MQFAPDDSTIPARIILNGEVVGLIRLPSLMALRDLRQRLNPQEET